MGGGPGEQQTADPGDRRGGAVRPSFRTRALWRVRGASACNHCTYQRCGAESPQVGIQQGGHASNLTPDCGHCCSW